MLASLAEQRQPAPVDDAIIEPVARDPDPRRGQRHAAARRARLRDADDREIGRPAAEIGDEDRCGLDQPRGIAVRGAERLVDIIYLGAECRAHRVVTPPRQLGIGARTGIFHLAPDDDTAWPVVARALRVRVTGRAAPRAPTSEPERLTT